MPHERSCLLAVLSEEDSSCKHNLSIVHGCKDRIACLRHHSVRKHAQVTSTSMHMHPHGSMLTLTIGIKFVDDALVLNHREESDGERQNTDAGERGILQGFAQHPMLFGWGGGCLHLRICCC
eukprot:1069397-Pelagomonas_calceolata.AAC.6